MSDAGSNEFESSSATPESPRQEQASTRRPRGGMLQDPMVRAMALASVGLVILFLVTVLGALMTGVAAPTGPRTLEEKQVAVSRAAVSQGTTDTAVWGQYLSALIANGDYGVARRVISDGRASISESATAEFTLAEARLLSAQGDYEAAIDAADEAMAIIDADYQARLNGAGFVAQRAKIDGQHPNYFVAVLIKAYAHRELEQWDEAIEQFDVYIGRNRGASDILVDRGTAKAAAGDVKGAEADFREALKFMPDNTEAQDGLDKIGAER